ncbi:uncharacterized protein LOC142557006 isoform X1 [Dermacentor variabilis]|uniref:uncharacterized protein LOC142557006 isoform X1 n=3 Tax=Dermacentor variabilis TaxID=34621 RepID=UPI003F5B28BF
MRDCFTINMNLVNEMNIGESARRKLTSSARKMAPIYHAEPQLFYLAELSDVQPMADYLGEKLVTGMQMPEQYDLTFFDAVAKKPIWKLAVSHGLTGVLLTNQTTKKLKSVAAKLKMVNVMGLLATSDVNTTLDTIPSIPGLEALVVTSECEGETWKEPKTLAYVHAVKTKTTLAVALSVTAAVWSKENQGNVGGKCAVWQDSTPLFMRCLEIEPFDGCRKSGFKLVENETLAEVVTYAKAMRMNTFAILSAHKLVSTAVLNRQFHLLKFSLPHMPAMDRLPESIPLRKLGCDDAAPRESALIAVRASSITVSDAESVETGMAVEAIEHHDELGQGKRQTDEAAETAASGPRQHSTPDVDEGESNTEKPSDERPPNSISTERRNSRNPQINITRRQAPLTWDVEAQVHEAKEAKRNVAGTDDAIRQEMSGDEIAGGIRHLGRREMESLGDIDQRGAEQHRKFGSPTLQKDVEDGEPLPASTAGWRLISGICCPHISKQGSGTRPLFLVNSTRELF